MTITVSIGSPRDRSWRTRARLGRDAGQRTASTRTPRGRLVLADDVHHEIVDAVEFAVGAQADDGVGVEAVEHDVVLLAREGRKLALAPKPANPRRRRRGLLQPVREAPGVDRVGVQDLVLERKAAAVKIARDVERGLGVAIRRVRPVSAGPARDRRRHDTRRTPPACPAARSPDASASRSWLVDRRQHAPPSARAAASRFPRARASRRAANSRNWPSSAIAYSAGTKNATSCDIRSSRRR